MASKLREQLIYELELRDRDEKTKKAYLSSMEKFVRFYHKSPDTLGIPEIRDYQHYLLTQKKFKANTVNRELCAIRFFLP